MKSKDSGKLIKAAHNPIQKREGTGRRFEDKTGEIRMMSCGQTAEIIAYRYDNDIDIQFEDGTIVANATYTSFEQGYIKHPDPDKCFWKQQNDKYEEDRVGKPRMMNNGMEAMIIAYRGVYDVDVQYEDGYIAKGVGYQSFIKGETSHPTVKTSRKQRVTEEDLKGKENKMSNDMMAKIIAARSVKDIDVQFEDGQITYNATYSTFKKGNVCHPSKKRGRVGLENIMNNGMSCKIIAYRGADDIDVQFADGTIVEHRGYIAFQKKTIRNPNVKGHQNRKKKSTKDTATQETKTETTSAASEEEFPDMFVGEPTPPPSTPDYHDKFLEYLEKGKALKKQQEEKNAETARQERVEQMIAAAYANACQQFLSTYTIPMIQKDLQKYIIGQDDLIKHTATFIYYHMLRQAQPELSIRPLLIAGPSGSGKTEVWRIAKKLYSSYLEIEIVDGSTITQEGWSGQRKLSSVLQSLNKATILVIDEFDKLASPSYSKLRDNVSHHIQAEFLKLLEGEYNTKGLRDEEDELKYDPSTVGIVMVGAFERVREEKEHENNHSLGFIQHKTEKYDEVVPIADEDLITFGVMPEIVGRISDKCTTKKLDSQQYLKIIRNQYSKVNTLIKELDKLGIDAARVIDDDKIIKLAGRSQSNMTGVRWVSAQVESELLELLINADLRKQFANPQLHSM